MQIVERERRDRYLAPTHATIVSSTTNLQRIFSNMRGGEIDMYLQITYTYRETERNRKHFDVEGQNVSVLYYKLAAHKLVLSCLRIDSMLNY